MGVVQSLTLITSFPFSAYPHFHFDFTSNEELKRHNASAFKQNTKIPNLFKSYNDNDDNDYLRVFIILFF